LKSFHSLNAGAYPTADQSISLLTSLTSYFQKPLKIRINGFEIRVKNDQRQVKSIFEGNPRQKVGKSVQGIPLENRSKFPSISLPMLLISTTDQYFHPHVEIVHKASVAKQNFRGSMPPDPVGEVRNLEDGPETRMER